MSKLSCGLTPPLECTWICVCPSALDRGSTLDINPSDSIADLVFGETVCGRPKCMCLKAAEDHLDHKWVMTRAGYDLHKEWEQEKTNRDQDSFGLYIYGHFDAYGLSELMQNMVLGTNHKERC